MAFGMLVQRIEILWQTCCGKRGGRRCPMDKEAVWRCSK